MFRRGLARMFLLQSQEKSRMPADSLLVTIFVVVMFTLFAGVLFWGDRQTRPENLTDSSHGKRRAF